MTKSFFGTTISIFLAVFLLTGCILLTSGRTFAYYKQYGYQKQTARAAESIEQGQKAILSLLESAASESAQEEYDFLSDYVDTEGSMWESSSEMTMHFRKGYVEKIREKIGKNPSEFCECVENCLPQPERARLYISKDPKPYLSTNCDDSGNLISITVKNVRLMYEASSGMKRDETYSFDIDIPDATIICGDDQLFKYCMMSKKGIYVSGETSSFVGDIYAGTHSSQEVRELELAYGEMGVYGGLNFLSTQTGLCGEHIVSGGDINLSGSFVIFKGDTRPVSVYSRRINTLNGYISKAVYSVEGEAYSTEKATEAVQNSFHSLDYYAQNVLSGLSDIRVYYDSANDSLYTGPYRTIISTGDVDIEEDVTGIIMTSENVFIAPGCNVEGLILCGDRIYLQGNNNVVANESILREMMKDETRLAQVSRSELENMTFCQAKDYIGGLKMPGIIYPDRYVVPYKQ